MRTAYLACLSICLLGGLCVPSLFAQSPRNMGVTFNGETDVIEPLATDTWHAVVASYRYDGDMSLLTNTYLVLARGGNLLHGLDLGYHLPTNELAIVKHGFWNATEATGLPGEAGKIIENDQAYLDCGATTVETADGDIVVSYRVKFKPGVLKGSYNVYQYIEDKDVRYEGFTIMGSVTIDGETGVHRTDMPRRWRNSLKPEGASSPALTLADDRVALYRLVVPRKARRIEQKAAADLGHNLSLICGADFPIITEGELADKGGPYISIGRTELLATSPCKWKSADLAQEGYALEVVDGNVFLYGGSGRGLMHGVYSLLEEDLGCRWYATDSIDTPSMARLSVSLAPRKYIPVLELRDPYILSMHDPNWSLRNKTNSPHARIPLAWGGSIRYHHMGHTYASYFPTKQYFAEHPEYYALVNGKRQPSQLCHTNEDVIRLSIEKTCEIFESHPDVTITAIGPNDGRGFCDCPACKKLDEENGGRSGSFFYHVNRIAEGVKKQFPDNHLICLAYLDYARPPTKLKVDDYVIVQLCTDSHAWKYQFCSNQESDEFQGIIKAWHAAKAKVFIWDYTTDYVHYLVPMANWPVVAENTRFQIRNGATGIMYESEMNDIDAMRGWVWAKQLWNPELDTKTLMRDFVLGYYKEAAQPIWEHQIRMWRYWERWHARPHECGKPSDNPLLNNLQCSYAPDGPMFTDAFMGHMRRCFTEAEELAASPEILERVRRAKLSLLYLELCQGLGYYSEFGDFIYGKSYRQSRAGKQAFKQRLDEFTSTCKSHSISRLGIAANLDKMTAKWQACIDADNPPLTKLYLPADWIFAADPQNKGVSEKWYADQKYYDAAVGVAGEPVEKRRSVHDLEEALSRIHINRGVGWEQQGFPGLDGGWYFQTLTVPEELAARKHLYLYFLRVNEQAWVYINGQPVFERSYASTGKGVGELTGAPFSFDAKTWLEPGIQNLIAVRVSHSTGLGGISFPALLVGTDEECTTAELAKFRY